MTWVLFVALTAAAVVATFLVMARASRAYDARKRRRSELGEVRQCSTCRSTMTFVGVEEVRVAGTAAEGWRALFGEPWAAGEGAVPLEVYACPTCRKVELALPPAAGA